MYFLIGDIHGSFTKLAMLINQLSAYIKPNDLLIFLGDYIDRGENSYKTVQLLYEISQSYNCVFLMGNHEEMFRDFLNDKSNKDKYFANGGDSTVLSYTREYGSLHIPETHKKILFSNIYFYEAKNFIAVHAGINPKHNKTVENCSIMDIIWIREKFFNANIKYDKTIIFGHTPTHRLHRIIGEPYIENKRNIIGIDTMAYNGGKLTCLVLPQKSFLQV